jgi:hypothetical protein
MSVTFPYPYSAPDGWTCSSCGAWVPNGCTHSCPTYIRWVNPPAPSAFSAEERIAAALERIALALDALGAKG